MKIKEEIEKLAKEYLKTLPGINYKSLYHFAQQNINAFIKGYNRCQQDNDLSQVTRLEVIDEKGRLFTKWDCSVELSYQDDNRTLKIFVKSKDKTNESA